MFCPGRKLLSKPLFALTNRFKTNNKPRNNKSVYPTHLSQKPPAKVIADYSSLGLKFPVKSDVVFTCYRLGWAPPPTQPPALPFMVSAFSSASIYKPSLYLNFSHSCVKRWKGPRQESIYRCIQIFLEAEPKLLQFCAK